MRLNCPEIPMPHEAPDGNLPVSREAIRLSDGFGNIDCFIEAVREHNKSWDSRQPGGQMYWRQVIRELVRLQIEIAIIDHMMDQGEIDIGRSDRRLP